ncbi:RNaseH domain-containing protein [Catellatospora sp. NPDC049111]|uniref:RNaseH domain-containing protein n=1 Tax=Catellatospora sp. NPDC049111 TaxID=3155271 RepID=UPI0033C575AB
MMITLAFPYTPEMAPAVYGYILSDELNDAWRDLQRRYTREPKSLPYYDLTAALRYVLNDYAAIRKGPKDAGTLVVTRRQADPDIVAKLFKTFEEDLATTHKAPFENRLAPILLNARPRRIEIARHLAAVNKLGNLDVEPWAYELATWHAVELLKGNMKLPNGEVLTLRPDTEGRLVAFNHPLPKNEPRGEQALHSISLTPITLPGYPHLLLGLDAHISRVTGFGGNSDTAWITADENAMIMHAAHRYAGEGKRLITGTLPKLVDSFTIQGALSSFTNDDLMHRPHLVRARHRTTPDRHPVGTGPGRRFLELLRQHAEERLCAKPVTLEYPKIQSIDVTIPTKAAREQAPAPLVEPITEHGTPLHLSVVYADDAHRTRAARAIAATLGVADSELQSPSAMLFDGALTVAFASARAEDLLEPGASDDRIGLVDELRRTAPKDGRHLVLIQTDKARATKGKPADDPKRQLRQALAARGSLTQGLDPASAGNKPDATDYPGQAAVKDLLRAAGLTSVRPSAVFTDPLSHLPCVVVGLSSRTENRPAKRMISLTALVTDGKDRPWQMLGYHPLAGGWNDLAVAIAAHHGTRLTAFDQRDKDQRDQAAGEYGERALNQLRIRYPDIPIVIFVDGYGSRNVWKGLANKHQGMRDPGALPHLSMPALDGISVVRVNNTDDGDLPRPVRDENARPAKDPNQVPGSTKLYKLAGSTAEAYYLVNRSRTDQAFDSAVRAGHRLTRFELEDAKTLRTNWHAMTMTEFLIMQCGAFTPQQLAALSARLCGNPLAWDGRTSRPAPLHLAEQVLADHPDRLL